MKLFAVLISVIVVVSANPDLQQWTAFKANYLKTYKNLNEESIRFNIFQNNLRKIETHNQMYKDGKQTYKMGITKFADLTEDEFENLWSMPPVQDTDGIPRFSAKPVVGGASSVDWSKEGAVLSVVDQKNCGCCWAFSAAGSIEGQNFIKHNKSVSLSVQELVDCSSDYGTFGCDSGWMYQAYSYVQMNGIGEEKDYKYEAKSKTCRKSNAKRVELKLTGYVMLDKYQETLRQAVENIGPISITMNHKYLMLYEKGIIDPPKCDRSPTHAVLVVGYGTENGVPYWLIRNSWGISWGEHGYFRLIRNNNNTCGIYDHAMYPTIE